MKQDEINALFDELRQVCSQYSKEVPKQRRPWPESIRTRILRLRFLGVSNSRISQETGIPVMTLYTWRMPKQSEAIKQVTGTGLSLEGQFLPVQIIRRRTGLPALSTPQPTYDSQKPMTVTAKGSQSQPMTVKMPNGILVECPGVTEAADFVRRLLS